MVSAQAQARAMVSAQAQAQARPMVSAQATTLQFLKISDFSDFQSFKIWYVKYDG